MLKTKTKKAVLLLVKQNFENKGYNSDWVSEEKRALGSRKKSSSTNGQTIKALTPPPLNGLAISGGTFFVASLIS